MSLIPDTNSSLLALSLFVLLAFDDSSSLPPQHPFRRYCFGCLSSNTLRFVFFFALYSFQGACSFFVRNGIYLNKNRRLTQFFFSLLSSKFGLCALLYNIIFIFQSVFNYISCFLFFSPFFILYIFCFRSVFLIALYTAPGNSPP